MLFIQHSLKESTPLLALKNLAKIRHGLAVQTSSIGELPVLHVSHFDVDGLYSNITDEFVTLENKDPYVLQPGEVLIAAKGVRQFAWLNTLDFEAVPSSSFLILTPDESKVLPEYLSIALNIREVAAQMVRLGAGSNIFSITKTELGELKIPVPLLKQQKKICTMTGFTSQITANLQLQIKEYQKINTALITKLLTH